MVTDQKLELVTTEALISVFKDHKSLGRKGIEEHHKNQFGESCLEADWRAEEIIIETLEKYKVPITIISEEHGKIELGTEFLGILDGLDGTNRYIALMNGDTSAKYGSLFAIFQGTDPFYNSYVVSGLIEHPTRRLFIASKGKGIFLTNVDTGVKTLLKSPSQRSLDSTRIIVDNYEKAAHHEFLQTYVRRLTPKFGFRNLNSTAAHYADFVSGDADIVFECTRKGNLEIAVGYGLVTERNGVMITLDEENIGAKRYLEFGQQNYIPIISAANIELAREFIRQIK